MNLLALPELPQLAGVLPQQTQSSSSAPYEFPGILNKPGYGVMKKGAGGSSFSWLDPSTWGDFSALRIVTFLLGFLLIAGAIFAPRDIKSAATTAAKAAAL